MVTALLAVALTMILMGSMTDRLRLEVRRTSNILGGQQMLLYALGGESMARLALERDHTDQQKKGNEQDTLSDLWAEKAPVFPLEQGGLITGRVEDLQGRFNLNNLLRNDQPNPIQIQRFRRLLEVLEADETLSDAVVDWIDTNDDSTGDAGAERDYYLTLPEPYQAANQPLATSRELLLVKGFDVALVERLEPWVTALPEGSALNINTALPTVLQTLDEALNNATARTLTEDRPQDGYKEINNFIKELDMFGIKPKAGIEGLALFSRYFLAEVEVKFAGQQMRLRSYLHRSKEGDVTVLHRTQEFF